MACKKDILVIEPSQPPESEWKFIEELRLPEHRAFNWNRTTCKGCEADLSEGISLLPEFPDHSGLLATAFEDMERFFNECGIIHDGSYKIITAYGVAGENDSFRIQLRFR